MNSDRPRVEEQVFETAELLQQGIVLWYIGELPVDARHIRVQVMPEEFGSTRAWPLLPDQHLHGRALASALHQQLLKRGNIQQMQH